MLATFDLPSVRRFIAGSNDRVDRFDADEGIIGSDLGKKITCYAQACDEFRAFLSQWAQAVFSGRVAFDREIEDLSKREGKQLLRQAKRLAAHGRAINGIRHDLCDLKDFHGSIVALDYLLENWVTPQLSVGPAPRVHIPDRAAEQMRESLGKLQPVASDWSLTDPKQVAVIGK